jgi:hypothetical protein
VHRMLHGRSRGRRCDGLSCDVAARKAAAGESVGQLTIRYYPVWGEDEHSAA